MTGFSLTALAREAEERHASGQAHAQLVLEGETLSASALAKLKQQADAGDEASKRAFAWLGESKEAIFTDALARVNYYRGRLIALATEERPDPDTVLNIILSAKATTMFVKEGNRFVEQTAVPIFTVYRQRQDAQRFGKPVRQPNASLERNGRPMTSTSYVYLAPTNPELDDKAFEAFRDLMERMPDVLLERLTATHCDVRHAVWLTLHFVPNSRLFPPDMADRIFKPVDGKLKDNSLVPHVRFDLSKREVLMLEENDRAAALVERLATFAAAPANK